MNIRPDINMIEEIVCPIENIPTAARGSPRKNSRPKRIIAYPAR
jgi:hypothetical protein